MSQTVSNLCGTGLAARAGTVFLALGWCPWVPASASESHCGPEQGIVFTCAVAGGKLLSLCADLGATAEETIGLRYRFGRLDEVELEFPESSTDSMARFFFAHYARYRVDETEVSFYRKDHRYVVFSSYRGEGESDDGAETREAGVKVVLPDGGEHTVLCETEPQNELWRLDGQLPCDSESELENANCEH